MPTPQDSSVAIKARQAHGALFLFAVLLEMPHSLHALILQIAKSGLCSSKITQRHGLLGSMVMIPRFHVNRHDNGIQLIIPKF
jgi:hypothetical protein